MATSPKEAARKRAYGRPHRAYREQLRPWAESGFARCVRCGGFIEIGQPWDVGHVDGSGRTLYQGIEHRRCNRSAGGKEGSRIRWGSKHKVSRVW